MPRRIETKIAGDAEWDRSSIKEGEGEKPSGIA
jgi:hypothetical protein